MAVYEDHPTSQIVKMFLLGTSGTGKTGSLASLALNGYRLRIADFDKGYDILVNAIKEADSSKLANLDIISFRDKQKYSSSGLVMDGMPSAYNNFLKALDKWDDGSTPAEWGPNDILVIDTLTTLGTAAFNWYNALNPAAKDKRSIVLLAQNAIEALMMKITDVAFNTNVIVISHLDFQGGNDGVPLKGYASSVGKALGPKLPKYINTLVLAETVGQGTNVKRKIRVTPNGIVDTKTANPFKINADLPIETGLHTLFTTLKG